MLECDNDDDQEDGEIDTKLALDPPELTQNSLQAYYQATLQARLTNLKNHNCKGMSLRLNKQLIIQPYI